MPRAPPSTRRARRRAGHVADHGVVFRRAAQAHSSNTPPRRAWPSPRARPAANSRAAAITRDPLLQPRRAQGVVHALRSLLAPALALLAALAAPASAQQGLLGEYFDDTALTQLADTRVDTEVDFKYWQGAPPGTAVSPDDTYGERWTGYVRIDASGDWLFSTNSSDGVRLWVGGQLVVDNWSLHGTTVDTGAVTLPAGWHALRLEHFQMGGGQMAMQLFFEGPGQSRTIVPADHLSVTPVGNLVPTVDAGPDLVLMSPDDSVLLAGVADDADGELTDWSWSQVSGPLAVLADPTQEDLLVEGMTVPGEYVFRLAVTDDAGDTNADEVRVSVVDCAGTGPVPNGILRPWHRLTLDLHGPVLDENGATNPFRDRRMSVRFIHGASGTVYTVPGYFAADGRAEISGATAGPVWRAHFSPDRPGNWMYTVSFRAGTDVAVSLEADVGTPTAFDGTTGCFEVLPPVAGEPGFRADGRIAYTGEHHLRHLGSDEPFLKGGANSPENLLSYVDFDQTPNAAHVYAPHLGDWQPGDPTWQGGKGKGLVGAMNYLASQGMNSVYFLTFNVAGDGNDVWMWTSQSERLRFDVSKLAQWEIVFEHMDDLGLALHVVTQEQENDTGGPALDDGKLGLERKLYYRELVARFGHHLGVSWNLGEENSNTTGQRQDFYDYIRAVDPYDHPIVVHSFPDEQEDVYGPLLGLDRLEGASLQSFTPDVVHAETIEWRDESERHGRPWVVAADETGPASEGVAPDAVDPTHDEPRKRTLWGNLMGGGAGVEWYFGYGHPDDDLDCEDWRSRELMWRQTDHALRLFRAHLPYERMAPADHLVTNPNAWCLAEEHHAYAVYFPDGGFTKLDLDDGQRRFHLAWFDPRHGGALQLGTTSSVEGPGLVSLGAPPSSDPGDDWAAVLLRDNRTPRVTSVEVQPGTFTGNEDIGVVVTATDPDGAVDIAEVAAHIVGPDFTYHGKVTLAELGPGTYGFLAKDVPPVMPGTWYIVGSIHDEAGDFHYVIETFEAQ